MIFKKKFSTFWEVKKALKKFTKQAPNILLWRRIRIEKCYNISWCSSGVHLEWHRLKKLHVCHSRCTPGDVLTFLVRIRSTLNIYKLLHLAGWYTDGFHHLQRKLQYVDVQFLHIIVKEQLLWNSETHTNGNNLEQSNLINNVLIVTEQYSKNVASIRISFSYESCHISEKVYTSMITTLLIYKSVKCTYVVEILKQNVRVMLGF